MKSKITGILISSGFSGRMHAFKPLLQFEGASFVTGIALKMSLVCDEVIVVVGFNHKLIEEDFQKTFNKVRREGNVLLNKFFADVNRKVSITYNENYKDGMITSLKHGLTTSGSSNWYLYHFVDQPGLPIRFYKEFINRCNEKYDWIQPVYNGQNAHPILFNRKIAGQISQLGINDSLKKISRSSSIIKKYWDCKYGQVLADIDTEDDYISLTQSEDAPLIEKISRHLGRD